MSDGKEAYNYIKANESMFDVIVIDLILSGKDGLSIIKEVRKMNTIKSIIVLTAYNSLEIVKQVSLLNVNYFMLKPFDLKDLEYNKNDTEKIMMQIKNNADKKVWHLPLNIQSFWLYNL